MQTIVFIGCNKSGTSREALKIAEEMGYFTVLFTDRPKYFQQREEFIEVHQMIYKQNLLNKDQLLLSIKELMKQGKKIKACLSFIDPFVSMSASLSEELGLQKVSSDALYKMENKTRFREELKELSSSPRFEIYEPGESLELFIQRTKIHLPVVVKTPESNGSKDVLFADNEDEFLKSMSYLNKKYEKHPILVEEYIEGRQFLVEVIVCHHILTIVAVIEQEVTKKSRFIVTGYRFPAKLKQDQYEELENVVFNIVDKIGLENGTCHLELRLSNREWKLIEINPRTSGGAMNQIILHGKGINLVKETLKLYLGEKPDLEYAKKNFVYTHYLTVETRGILQKVTGKNRAKKQAGIKEVYVKPRKGSVLTPPLSMGDRYAYVLATAEAEEHAKERAINASKEIKFFLEPF